MPDRLRTISEGHRRGYRNRLEVCLDRLSGSFDQINIGQKFMCNVSCREIVENFRNFLKILYCFRNKMLFL